MERALNMSHATADRHVKDAVTKGHIKAKPGKPIGKQVRRSSINGTPTKKSNPLSGSHSKRKMTPSGRKMPKRR